MSARNGNDHGGFEDVETITDPEGVIAVISRRRSNNMLSVAVMKEFDREGETVRTAFLQRRHIQAAQRVLALAAERMDAIKDIDMAKSRTGTR